MKSCRAALLRQRPATASKHAAMHGIAGPVTAGTITRSAFGTTANVATLLGLLGTIFGLMHSFAAAASVTSFSRWT